MNECLNCNKSFKPSKNDKRIKFCSEECRKEYRKKTSYMKNYYSCNIDKWKERQSEQSFKNKKNEARRLKYANDEEYRNKIKAKVVEYNKRNPNKKTEQHLREYGLTMEDYNNMLKAQNNACAICGGINNTEIYIRRPLFIDHNHNTNQIRGLLCDRCNFLIGNARENINILSNAIEYLRRYE